MASKRKLWRLKLIGVICLCLPGGKQTFALTCAQVQPPAYNTSIYVSPAGADSNTCGAMDVPEPSSLLLAVLGFGASQPCFVPEAVPY